MRISDWSSDVCSSDLVRRNPGTPPEMRDRVGQRQPPHQITEQQPRPEPPHDPPRSLALALDVPPQINRRRRARACEMKQVASRPVALGKAQIDASCLGRSEEHPSALQYLMRTKYAVICLKKKHQIEPKKTQH